MAEKELPNRNEDFETRLYSKAACGYRGLFNKGPEGLGDPTDRSLNDIEWKVAIPAQQREIIQREHCAEANEVYEACRQENGFFTEFFKCSNVKNQLEECVNNWMDDVSIRERAINEYLEDRSAYRLTGLSKWEREHPEIVQRERERRWIRSRSEDIPEEKSLREAYAKSWNSFKDEYSKPRPESKEDG